MNPLVQKMVRPSLDEMQTVGVPATRSDAAIYRIRRALQQVRERFVYERVNGFRNPDTGEVFEPVSAEEAEQRWAVREPKILAVLYSSDANVASKLGTGKDVPPTNYGGPTGQPTSFVGRDRLPGTLYSYK